MRGILILAAIALVLVVAGVISIQWGNGSATIDFHEDVARERANQVLKKAEVLEANVKARLRKQEQGTNE